MHFTFNKDLVLQIILFHFNLMIDSLGSRLNNETSNVGILHKICTFKIVLLVTVFRDNYL